MKLEAYMRLANLKDDDLAAKLGVNRSMVSRWRRGKAKPDWDNLPKIEAATNGAVTAVDFIDRQAAQEAA
jgi:transcriptional regulator with XRE-family HTH domain